MIGGGNLCLGREIPNALAIDATTSYMLRARARVCMCVEYVRVSLFRHSREVRISPSAQEMNLIWELIVMIFIRRRRSRSMESMNA